MITENKKPNAKNTQENNTSREQREVEDYSKHILSLYGKKLNEEQFTYNLQAPISGIASLRFNTAIKYKLFKNIRKKMNDETEQMEAMMNISKMLCVEKVKDEEDFWDELEVQDVLAIMIIMGEILKKKTSLSHFSKKTGSPSTSSS